MPVVSRIYTLRVNSSNAKKVFTYPEVFDSSGISVYLEDEYGNFFGYVYDYTIDANAFSYENVGQKNIWISYGDYSTYYTVTLKNDWSIRINSVGVKKNFYQYADTFTTSGLQVFLAINGVEAQIATSDYSISVSGLVGNYFEDYGSKYVRISVTREGETKTKQYGIQVEQLEYYIQFINTPKTNYHLNDTFNNPQVKITYSNGDEDIHNTTISSISDSASTPTSSVTTSGNSRTITLSFTPLVTQLGTLTKTLDIKVRDWTLDLNTTNVKTEYFYESSAGEITNDSIDITGLVARKKWDFDNSVYEYESISNSNLSKSLSGTTVTISSNSKSATYSITKTQNALLEIELNISGVKTTFGLNEAFTTDGLIVTGVWKNGTSRTLIATEWETDDTTSITGTSGEHIVTIKSTDNADIIRKYAITVLGIKNIKVVPIKTTYFVGESFRLAQSSEDTTDVEIYAIDSNNSQYRIYGDYTSIKNGDEFRTQGAYKNKISVVGEDGVLESEYKINVVLYNGGYTENHYTLKPNTSVTSIIQNGKTINFRDDNNEPNGMYPLYPNGVYSNANNDCKGYVVLGNDGTSNKEKQNAHIVLFDDYTNISHDGNIVVKFPHINEENSNKINGCKFGHIYNNRLFVSGNSKYKNCDWHSGDVNRSQDTYGESGDYTYFADLDYCYYGTDNTAIVGYDVSRNGDLMVLKESSNQEATIYKRSIKYENVVDSSGNTLKYVEDRYTLEDMNANGGLGGFTKDTIVNHLGDTYFLTKEGIKKLSYRANIYENAKYTYDVSSKINFKIKNEKLQASVLFNDNDKLILKTDRGLYIGIDDFRESEDYHELEWYYLDIQDVRCILSFVDNYIIYGNSIGEIFKLDFNKYFYKDRDRIELPSGTILPSTIDDNTIITSINDLTYDNNTLNQTDIITYNDDYEDYFNENDILHILGKNGDNWKPLHAEIGWYCTWSRAILDFELVSSNGSGSPKYIYVKDTSPNKNMYYDGRIVYIDQYIYGMGLTDKFNGKKYRLKLIESGYDDTDGFFEKYGLLDATSNITVDIPNGTHSMRLSFALDENYEARIVDIDRDNHTFKLKGDHNNYLELIIYNNESYTSYRGYITKEKNISAYYITKPFDFGTMMYEKNVFMWTFANDTGLASETLIKYYTSRKQAGYQVGISPLSMNMKDLSFFSFSFENDMLPHTYTRMRTLANISYLALIFENTNDSNIVMNNLTILYSLARTAKGVK